MSLWPDFNELEIVTPKSFLEKSAGELITLTKGYVSAEILPVSSFEAPIGMDAPFIFSFDLVGRMLDNYRYTAFYISHDITMYPVTIRLENDIMREINPNISSILKADTPAVFEDTIRRTFHSERIKKVVGAIIALSKKYSTPLEF